MDTCSVTRCKGTVREAVVDATPADATFVSNIHPDHFHSCPHWAGLDDPTWQAQNEAGINSLRSKIDKAAACQYASELNGGRTCCLGHTEMMGLVGSEYATLKFLEKTTVPAPRALGYYGICRDGSDRGIGASFLFVEELPGKAWGRGGMPATEANRPERVKLWSRLADILAELAKYPFPKASSLCVGKWSCIQVRPVASDRFTMLDPEGPFEIAIGYYQAFAEQYLVLIADRQLYTTYPVEAYLVYRFLKENAWQLVQDEGDGTQRFFLNHVDDHGGHILVDDETT